MDIIEWDAEAYVVDIVLEKNHVTTLVESVLMVARTGLLEYAVTYVRNEHDLPCCINFQIILYLFKKK